MTLLATVKVAVPPPIGIVSQYYPAVVTKSWSGASCRMSWGCHAAPVIKSQRNRLAVILWFAFQKSD
jgi:hypothetical protein